MIFDEATLRKLTQLTLVANRVRVGTIKGDRRSSRHGSSVEFADFRDYVPGDDLRRLDWNVYARLERPFIKLLEEEEDLAVHLLVDASKSMAWGDEEGSKFRYTLHLTAALGSIALAAGDRLTVAVLKHGRVETLIGPTRGPQQTLRLLRTLEGLSTDGVTDLNAAVREYAIAARRPGLAFLVSDLFAPEGFSDGVVQLQSRGYEVNLLHVLSIDEIDPPFSGDLRLVDVETGDAQEVSLDRGLRAAYRRHVDGWRRGIQTDCRKREIGYLALSTDQPWEKVVLAEMRLVGMVR